jgi:hypothetical protein
MAGVEEVRRWAYQSNIQALGGGGSWLYGGLSCPNTSQENIPFRSLKLLGNVRMSLFCHCWKHLEDHLLAEGGRESYMSLKLLETCPFWTSLLEPARRSSSSRRKFRPERLIEKRAGKLLKLRRMGDYNKVHYESGEGGSPADLCCP